MNSRMEIRGRTLSCLKAIRGASPGLLASCILLLLLTAFLQAPAAGRIVAIGDVHGNLDGLVAILQKANLIDQTRHWTGDSATLVQTGDLLDRGPRSRDVLDLMMALQKEAPRRNGSVRISLGNHEVMTMMGDLRYAVPQDYAAFVDSRSEQRRKAAFQNYSSYQKQHGASVNEGVWMQAHPAGFIERQEAFSARGAYGRWLRTLPAVNKVDAAVFLHGGLSPELTSWTVEKINAGVSNEIRAFDKYKQYMVEKKIALAFFTFDELIAAARAALDASKAKPQSKEDAGDNAAPDNQIIEDFLQLGGWLSVSENGPLWFRGYDNWTEDEGERRLSPLMQGLNIKRAVVGHTPQPNGEIRRRFGGKIFLIDTGMLSSYYPGGKASALEISKDRIRAIYIDRETDLN